MAVNVQCKASEAFLKHALVINIFNPVLPKELFFDNLYIIPVDKYLKIQVAKNDVVIFFT